MIFSSELTIKFFKDLLAEIPEFQSRYAEHISDNDGLLPYPAMDEFSRFVIEKFRDDYPEQSTNKSGVFQRAANFLNRAYHQDEELATLIRSTFVESVQTHWREREVFDAMLANLSEELRQEVTAGLGQE